MNENTSRDEAAYRFIAAQYRLAAARADFNAECVKAAHAVTNLVQTWADAERREVQQHPDLAFLDAQLTGFYGPVGEAE